MLRGLLLQIKSSERLPLHLFDCAWDLILLCSATIDILVNLSVAHGIQINIVRRTFHTPSRSWCKEEFYQRPCFKEL